MKRLLLFIVIIFLSSCSVKMVEEKKIDDLENWQAWTAQSQNISIQKSNDLNGVIDLMGNGGLMLEKSRFNKTTNFQQKGEWTSKWFSGNAKSIEVEMVSYGNEIDIRKGWQKFTGNPVLSGENVLLPLNKNNITDQTILLPKPGGVPQDQSILLGKGKFAGKWLLFFNHTPDHWPYEYYWSFAVAYSLAPLKRGINPFKIDTAYFPTYGPIEGQAPNDWLEVDGTIYAPDETYDGESHMWKSTDYLHWEDLGAITGINGADPGMVYDGENFYLFNEDQQFLNYNQLNDDFTSVVKGDPVLDVGDHTGDADLAFFNNQWHMFFDDGEHLHYNIGYASTSAEEFPHGWKLENDIYGPYIPDQGQLWDNDTKDGNDFGTGDADIAVEGNTLYMFTERPIGAAYRELTEIMKNTGQSAEIKIEYDTNNDGKADDSTDWTKLENGKNLIYPKKSQNDFRILLKMVTENVKTSPLIREISIK